MKFVGEHILSVSQFARSDIDRLFAVAEKMIPYANRKKVTRVLEEQYSEICSLKRAREQGSALVVLGIC